MRTHTWTWHTVVGRGLVALAVGALVVEAAAGTAALLADFGPHLVDELAGRASAAPWVFGWELLQVLVALSLVPVALLVRRGERRGWFAAAILQLTAVALSGYHVVHTLPDSWALIGLVTATTLLLATRAVREWCFGDEKPAFEALVADH